MTRIRGDNAGTTLDLLFSNDDSIVENVKVESPLGKSDHACIYVTCDVQQLIDNSKRQVYMYEKADYNLMKQRLKIDWAQYLTQDLNTENKWKKFIDKLNIVIEECVPVKAAKVGMNKCRKRLNENLPMNRNKEKTTALGKDEKTQARKGLR